MTNTQTAIKEAIFALEHGNKTWKALDILKAALAESEQASKPTVKQFGTIHEENGDLIFTGFHVNGNQSKESQETIVLLAVISRLTEELKNWSK
jgi:hypothetical protein